MTNAPYPPEFQDPEIPAPLHSFEGDPFTPDTYNPADYRWVPVRRRPRYDGWTEEKQRRFIEVLADTGIVTAAAKAVGMSRESAARLRRSEHGAAFARAWDAARHHAGSVLEDIAFERAIEGVEQHIFDENGTVICTKRVYNDRLLTFLLTHLKPDRYARAALTQPESPPTTVADVLRDMEPQLPAPAEALIDADTLADELVLADVADGDVPDFLSEQHRPKSDARVEAETWAAQLERGKAAFEKTQHGMGALSDDEFRDMCLYVDPSARHQRGTRRFR
jgi:hypothetical protein